MTIFFAWLPQDGGRVDRRDGMLRKARRDVLPALHGDAEIIA
jgi:hypothetical protein